MKFVTKTIISTVIQSISINQSNHSTIMAPVAIDTSVLADENSQVKEMESLEPLTPKENVGPPNKKAKKEKGTSIVSAVTI